MNVSPFTLLVARGAELPAIDPSITQTQALVDETQDQGPAAQAEVPTEVSDPVAQPDHADTDGSS